MTDSIQQVYSGDANEGVIVYYASRFGNVDKVGDVVDPHAFDAWLTNAKAIDAVVPVIWSHDWSSAGAVIGYSRAREDFVIDSKGLLVTAHVDLTNPTAKIVHGNANRGTLQASFSYSVQKEKRRGDGANVLLAVDVLETGPCAFGMNDQTRITSVKASVVREHAVAAKAMEDQLYRSKLGYIVSTADALGRDIPPTIKAEANRLGILDVDQQADDLFNSMRRCRNGHYLPQPKVIAPGTYPAAVCATCDLIVVYAPKALDNRLGEKAVDRLVVDQIKVIRKFRAEAAAKRRGVQVAAKRSLREMGADKPTEAELFRQLDEIERTVESKKSAVDRTIERMEKMLQARQDGW